MLRYFDSGDRVPSCRTCVEAIAVRRDAPRDLGLFYAAVRIRASLNPTARTAQSEFDKAAPATPDGAPCPWDGILVSEVLPVVLCDCKLPLEGFHSLGEI